jgi:peptidoglycan/xylan/chitin deacetylase (PgdA/CDA1 family)
MIALTFDDGPGPTTNRVLDALKSHHVSATFFIIGRNLMDNPWTNLSETGIAIVKRIILDRHHIGNHTFSHSKNIQVEDDFLKEIEQTDLCIKKLFEELHIPFQTPPFRLPFGVRENDRRLEYLAGVGRTHVPWSKNFNDWHEGPIDSLLSDMVDYVEEREIRGLNSVLGLHDSGIGNDNGSARDATADAVESLLDMAATKGWKFCQAPLKEITLENNTINR